MSQNQDTRTSSLKTNKFKPSDFEFGALLGEGAYARVFHAVLKETGEAFAIKMLDKTFIRRHGKEHFVLNERKVLSMLDHPNLMKLYSTFQDSTSLYFVLQLAHGGELLQQIKKLGGCSLKDVQFYLAEIIVALEALHKLGIIHRDLKPENILLSSNGHIVLTDFGTAKICAEDEKEEIDTKSSLNSDEDWSAQRRKKNNSFVGTAEYVSPEVLSDEKASFAVDLWALGCVAYILIAGKPPFRGGSEYLTFQKILQREFWFTPDFSDEAKDLINMLLQMNPQDRPTFEQLKNHAFFESVDFTDMHLQESPAFDIALQDHPSVLEYVDSDDDFTTNSRAVSDLGNASARTSGSGKSCGLEIWKRFIDESEETIVKCGLVSKRRGMFSKKRQLILTSLPRFVYVDCSRMVKKGEIKWSDSLWAELRDKSTFYIHTAWRNYFIKSLDCDATEWIDAIHQFMN